MAEKFAGIHHDESDGTPGTLDVRKSGGGFIPGGLGESAGRLD